MQLPNVVISKLCLTRNSQTDYVSLFRHNSVRHLVACNAPQTAPLPTLFEGTKGGQYTHQTSDTKIHTVANIIRQKKQNLILSLTNMSFAAEQEKQAILHNELFAIMPDLVQATSLNEHFWNSARSRGLLTQRQQEELKFEKNNNAICIDLINYYISRSTKLDKWLDVYRATNQDHVVKMITEATTHSEEEEGGGAKSKKRGLVPSSPTS